MDVNKSFEFYGNYDVTGLKELLVSDVVDWHTYELRQQICYEMKHTRSVPIIFDPNFFNPTKRIFFDVYEKFEFDLKMISLLISEKRNSEGYIHNALLVKLLAKKQIPPHKDIANKIIQTACRIHIPILTNSNCFFKIGEEIKNLKEGEIWEINNDKLVHSVTNDGDEDRVHLVLDWFDEK